jgi:hypothetical protein
MNPTKTVNPSKSDRSIELAGALFDEVLVPLADARRGSGAPPFFPLKEEASRASYFVAPALKAMSPADFELKVGGKSEALIDALATYWSKRGETGLAAMAPRLKQLADALGDEAAENDGKVDILCYTLF